MNEVSTLMYLLIFDSNTTFIIIEWVTTKTIFLLSIYLKYIHNYVTSNTWKITIISKYHRQYTYVTDYSITKPFVDFVQGTIRTM